MEILYLLIPLSLVLLGLIVWVLMWAINSGQFDDMEGPAHRILLDDETPLESKDQKKAGGETGFKNGL
ncbi:MAG: cbb3-type cytochrome oxidase assembly protein CcoS [Gammaproteobacteria bacterium]|nr:cbb3-type cytochrome oxidase assembly protein CcoS [Gammaproteobacteria bacterium]